MIKEVDGKISGDILGTLQQVSGNINLVSSSIDGDVKPAGQKIVYDAEWGGIKGDIENQDDLQLELRKRDINTATVAEIEAILYLD